jgi:hypothetical protein
LRLESCTKSGYRVQLLAAAGKKSAYFPDDWLLFYALTDAEFTTLDDHRTSQT